MFGVCGAARLFVFAAASVRIVGWRLSSRKCKQQIIYFISILVRPSLVYCLVCDSEFCCGLYPVLCHFDYYWIFECMYRYRRNTPFMTSNLFILLYSAFTFFFFFPFLFGRLLYFWIHSVCLCSKVNDGVIKYGGRVLSCRWNWKWKMVLTRHQRNTNIFKMIWCDGDDVRNVLRANGGNVNGKEHTIMEERLKPIPNKGEHVENGNKL